LEEFDFVELSDLPSEAHASMGEVFASHVDEFVTLVTVRPTELEGVLYVTAGAGADLNYVLGCR
jgi:hypothetical protein